MSEPSQPPLRQPGPPPGWYPDPAGAPRLRWWDGAAWTAHLSGPPAYPQPAQQLQPPPQAPRPTLDAQAPIYNPMIWLIVLLPVLTLAFAIAWMPVFRIGYIGPNHVRTLDPASIFTVSYVLVLACGCLVYAASIVLAYLDWQWLARAGVVRPFHWAWAFLSATVYIIGRSVIVHRVAPGRGLGPVWAWAGMAVAGLTIAGVKMAFLISGIAAIIPR